MSAINKWLEWVTPITTNTKTDPGFVGPRDFLIKILKIQPSAIKPVSIDDIEDYLHTIFSFLDIDKQIGYQKVGDYPISPIGIDITEYDNEGIKEYHDELVLENTFVNKMLMKRLSFHFLPVILIKDIDISTKKYEDRVFKYDTSNDKITRVVWTPPPSEIITLVDWIKSVESQGLTKLVKSICSQ